MSEKAEWAHLFIHDLNSAPDSNFVCFYGGHGGFLFVRKSDIYSAQMTSEYIKVIHRVNGKAVVSILEVK